MDFSELLRQEKTLRAMQAYEFWKNVEQKGQAEQYSQVHNGNTSAAVRAARIWVYADKRIAKIVFGQVTPFDSFN